MNARIKLKLNKPSGKASKSMKGKLSAKKSHKKPLRNLKSVAKKAPIRRFSPTPDQGGSAKKQLLASARELFAKKGLSGTSIRDIAQNAKLNSSLISYYFYSKEGLYRSCIEEIAQASLEMTERVLQAPANETEFKLRLDMFLESLFQLFLEDRNTGLILIREYDRQQSPAGDIFRASYLRIIEVIGKFFRQAQQLQIVDAAKDPRTLAGLLFGCVTSLMRMDHLQQKTLKKSLHHPQEKRLMVRHLVDLFTIPPKNKT